jgi:hypothetical protein
MGMALVIVPVLLAILCSWALEQVEGTRVTVVRRRPGTSQR